MKDSEGILEDGDVAAAREEDARSVGVQVPSGTLSERLRQLAAIHERNAVMTAPIFGSGMSRGALETANRHTAIHERAAADCREAAALLAERSASHDAAKSSETEPKMNTNKQATS